MHKHYDIAIIGGGINGCGLAAEAQSRGLSVFLCEQDDLAGHTSSASTKLIHGGLRYLEYMDFGLVKKSLDERQRLLELAPYLVEPLSIALPLDKNARPAWLVRSGLFIYDHLSCKNKLPASKSISRTQNPDLFKPLKNTFTKGFNFYDCKTCDARLTLVNALEAKRLGAEIAPRTRLIKAEVQDKRWQLSMQPQTGDAFTIESTLVINATGPWVTGVSSALQIPLEHKMTLVKGSHIVVKRLYEGEEAYLLQHEDKRVIFVIPYYGFTLIGTTEVAINGSAADVSIDADEITYLRAIANRYFTHDIQEKDIIQTFSGVRPLLSEAGKALKSISRDYAYELTQTPAPALTIYGGKITTYRQLSAAAIDSLKPLFPNLHPSQTKTTPLPGAYWQDMDYVSYKAYASSQYAWLSADLLKRLLNTYGCRVELILAGCNALADLGQCFADGVYQVEIDYLLKHEWACTVDDILWRRTKVGFSMNAGEVAALSAYLKLQRE